LQASSIFLVGVSSPIKVQLASMTRVNTNTAHDVMQQFNSLQRCQLGSLLRLHISSYSTQVPLTMVQRRSDIISVALWIVTY